MFGNDVKKLKDFSRNDVRVAKINLMDNRIYKNYTIKSSENYNSI